MNVAFDKLQLPEHFGAGSRTMDEALSNIYSLFGPSTVLVPLAKDDKPDACWDSNTRASDTAVPAYQAKLRKASIAVLTGPARGNLCAIELKHARMREEVLAAVP